MDTLSNMIIMIKNGSVAGKKSVVLPYSKLKNAVAECLRKEGYIAGFNKKIRKGFPVLELELSYTEGKPKVNDVLRISKQSKRVYFGVKDIHPVLGGKGLLVLSTPKGVMSGKDARKSQTGGEALFKIW